MRTLIPAAALAALLATGAAAAQESSPYLPERRDPMGIILVNGPTPYTVGARKLTVYFTHRFRMSASDGSSHDLWGLDGGADTGIGFATGLAPHFDLSLYRAALQEDFEAAAKFLVFEQAPRVPLTLAVRAGADLLRRPGIENSSRPFFQLLLARRIAPGVNLTVSPSWVADTPRLHDVVNVPLGLTFPLPGQRLVELEYVPKNRDLETSREAWHVGFSKALGGHIFEIVIGNSRATTVDQTLGGDSVAPFKRGDVRLGFNIFRDFSF